MKTALTAFTFLFVASLLTADDKAPPETGSLKSVKGNKITLAAVSLKSAVNGGKSSSIPEKTLTVAEDAKITFNGKTAKLADLKTSCDIQYRLDKDMKVTEIEQTLLGPGQPGLPVVGGFGGKLKSIENGKLYLTFGKPFQLDKNVKVTINGKDASLDDLKAGKNVDCEFGKDGKTIVSIKQDSK